MKPSAPAVFEAFIAARIAKIRVAMPGTVVAYDAERQRVDVQPDLMDGELDEEEQRQAAKLAVITDVPVQFQGSGPYRITFPIAVGDSVLLVFSSSSLSRWKAAGGGLVDPGNDQRHSLTDAIAIPGLEANASTDAPTNALVVHAAAMKLGGPDAIDTVARESDLQVLATAIQGAIDGLGFGSALKAALTTAGWPNCTSTVKAK
jgi:hypothetical protein